MAQSMNKTVDLAVSGTWFRAMSTYGKVMIGEQSGKVWADKGEKKIVTNRDIQYHGGGLRGSFWVRRMQEVHGRHLERGVKRIIRNS